MPAMRRWHIIQSKPHQADRVAAQLQELLALEVYNPKIAVRAVRGARKLTQVRQLFPNYLFARLDLPAEWKTITFTRGVAPRPRRLGGPAVDRRRRDRGDPRAGTGRDRLIAYYRFHPQEAVVVRSGPPQGPLRHLRPLRRRGGARAHPALARRLLGRGRARIGTDRESLSMAVRARRIVRSLRPGQWVKNVLVFAPLVFAQQALDPRAAGRAAGRVRALLPRLRRGLPRQRPARPRPGPPAPRSSGAARSPRGSWRPAAAAVAAALLGAAALGAATLLDPPPRARARRLPAR